MTEVIDKTAWINFRKKISRLFGLQKKFRVKKKINVKIILRCINRFEMSNWTANYHSLKEQDII